MNDIEHDVRAALDEQASLAPPPHEAGRAVARARRRRAVTTASGVLGVATIAVLTIVAARAIRTPDDGTPAAPQTATIELNGITITYPEDWAIIDPEAAGWNGPEPTSDSPRLILALKPFNTGAQLGCPGQDEGTPSTFLMTIQQMPLAQEGDPAAVPWPVELKPLFGSTGSDGTIGSGCYPGWEFLRAGWTEAGRTFEARVGFAPEITDQDRDAVVAAYTSMEFAPVEPTPTPLPEVPEAAQLEHGGTAWGVYLEVSESFDDPALEAAKTAAAALGYEAGGGEVACDQPAAKTLGVPSDAFTVAIYFDTRAEAEVATALFDQPPVGIARVTTFCLD